MSKIEITTIYRLDGKPFPVVTSPKDFNDTDEVKTIFDLHTERLGQMERVLVDLIKINDKSIRDF